MNANAAFGLLLGLGTFLLSGLLVATSRLLLAGSASHQSASQEVGILCLFIPSPGDIPVHLASYVLISLTATWLARTVRGAFAEQRRTARFLSERLTRRTSVPPWLGRLAADVGLAGRLDVVEDPAPRCFCYGLAQPRVCVTTGLLAVLAVDELEAVLRHEAAHASGFDPLRLLGGRAFAAGFPLAPALADLFAHFRLHIEVAADRTAVGRMRGPLSLARALDKLLDDPPPASTTLPNAGHANTLVLRIGQLLGEPVPLRVLTSPTRVATSVATAALIATLALAPVDADHLRAWSAVALSPWC